MRSLRSIRGHRGEHRPALRRPVHRDLAGWVTSISATVGIGAARRGAEGGVAACRRCQHDRLPPQEGHRADARGARPASHRLAMHGVEFFEKLATTQYMNHIRPTRRGPRTCADAPRVPQGGPFDTGAHGRDAPPGKAAPGDTTSPASGCSCGGFYRCGLSCPAVDRPMRAMPPAASSASTRRRQQPLFRLRIPRTMISHLAEPINVTDPLTCG